MYICIVVAIVGHVGIVVANCRACGHRDNNDMAYGPRGINNMACGHRGRNDMSCWYLSSMIPRQTHKYSSRSRPCFSPNRVNIGPDLVNNPGLTK